jgi:hypothetical protein
MLTEMSRLFPKSADRGDFSANISFKSFTVNLALRMQETFGEKSSRFKLLMSKVNASAPNARKTN